MRHACLNLACKELESNMAVDKSCDARRESIALVNAWCRREMPGSHVAR